MHLQGPAKRGINTSFPESRRVGHICIQNRRVSQQRGSLHVVAANAPSEGSNQPVSREDLINHLKSGCRPKDKWRIGTEHEKFGFNLTDCRRMDYDKISQVFDKLESRFGWQRMKEGPLTIGVQLDGQSVTLEPGGQFELSGAPLETLHQVSESTTRAPRLSSMDSRFLGLI